MKTMEVPAFTSPLEGYKVYEKFRGIDLLTDETQIDDSRSPWAVNLISDAGGQAFPSAPTSQILWETRGFS